MYELRALVCDTKPDIILLTETWLKETTPEGMYSLTGYTDHSFMNPCETRGGVTIYVKDGLAAEPITDLMEMGCRDAMWLKVTAESKSIITGVIYRKGSRGIRQDDKILKCLDKLDPTEEILVCGDFNLPKINWNTGEVNDSANSATQKFVNKIQDKFLTQKVISPTRRRGRDEPSLIDWVLVSNEDSIESIEHLSPLGAGDHDVLMFDHCFAVEVPILTNRLTFDFKNINFKEVRKKVKPEMWTDLWTELDVDKQVDIFSAVYNEITSNLPMKPVKQAEESKPMWWNDKADRALKQKHLAWNRYCNRGRTRTLYNEYSKSRRKTSKTLKQIKFDFERNLARNCKRNVKMFYKYANSKSKSKAPIARLKVGGNMSRNMKSIRGEFGRYFESVHTDETDLEELYFSDFMNLIEGRGPQNSLDDFEIKDEEVLEQLRSINPFKSLGPDSVHPRFLKELALELHQPIAHIFRTSLASGKVPRAWKEADIVPIFKKGSKTLAETYRPISLTSHLGKILERIIRKRVSAFLENGILVDEQHGFRPNRSCLTNILACMETWTSWLDEGKNFDAIYLDFQRAFDSVPHQRLISRLYEIGINGPLLHWFSSFLTDRLQGVKLTDGVSDPVAVRSGVPQGSVLGPICFITYINDIFRDLCSAEGSIFADDTKIYAVVNSTEDASKLQSNLDKIVEWGQ